MGHQIIAEYMASQAGMDHVQLIVSPQNPLKDAEALADEMHRLEMCKMAVAGNPRLSVNDIEYSMEKPSYTIDTLTRLRNESPDVEFRLIIGSDSIAGFTNWKEWEHILDWFVCCVYLRPGFPPGDLASHPNVMVFKGPFIDLSATYIRECLEEGASIRYLVSREVEQYIAAHSLYSVHATR